MSAFNLTCQRVARSAEGGDLVEGVIAVRAQPVVTLLVASGALAACISSHEQHRPIAENRQRVQLMLM